MTVITLAACGFEPVYQKNKPTAIHHELLMVEVPLMTTDRMEQIFSTTLIDSLNPQARKVEQPYLLQVELKRLHEPAIIQQDREITRYRVVLEAKYRLVEKATGKVVEKDTVRLRTSYDDLTSEFANYSSQVDAEQRAAVELAQTIRSRLISFFAK